MKISYMAWHEYWTEQAFVCWTEHRWRFEPTVSRGKTTKPPRLDQVGQSIDIKQVAIEVPGAMAGNFWSRY